MQSRGQYAIVYDDLHLRGIVYDTAYDSDQAEDAIANCRMRRQGGNVRKVLASAHKVTRK